eukprot:COSAG02_NODE_32_length_50374_cov_46.674013_28_plen_77_part_00
MIRFSSARLLQSLGPELYSPDRTYKPQHSHSEVGKDTETSDITEKSRSLGAAQRRPAIETYENSPGSHTSTPVPSE